MALISANEAIQKLNAGDVIGVPTETVYGLAGIISDQAALKKIFTIKERPFFDPLIVHVTDLAAGRKLVKNLPAPLESLAERFWPGPLTIVAEKNHLVSDLITAGLPTVALRAPHHPVAQKILAATGPFAAPSANRFGKTSPTCADHVLTEFQGQVDIVDGGACEIGLESSVVTLTNDALVILRPGQIGVAELESVAKSYGLEVRQQASHQAPGHLPHHYQPAVPLVLVMNERDDRSILREATDALRKTNFVLQHLQLPGDSRQAARILYSELRRLAAAENNLIVATPARWTWFQTCPDLRDRLTRAASLIL